MKIEDLPENYRNMPVFIAKANTWYMEGAQVELVAEAGTDVDGVGIGLFKGNRAYDGRLDEEMCGYDEFDIVEKWLLTCKDCGKTTFEVYHGGHANGCRYKEDGF